MKKTIYQGGKPPKVPTSKPHRAAEEKESEGSSVGENSSVIKEAEQAPDSSYTQELRAMLGPAAAAVSSADLQQAVHEEDVKRAVEMGLSSETIEAAQQELRDAAVQEGKSPDSIDSLVALESLVAQDRAIEEMSRNEPDFSDPRRYQDMPEDRIASEKQDPSTLSKDSAEKTGDSEQARFGPTAQEPDAFSTPDVDVEAEVEMEMSMGGD